MAKMNETQQNMQACGVNTDEMHEHIKLIYKHEEMLNTLVRDVENHRQAFTGIWAKMDEVGRTGYVTEERINALQEDKKNFWALILAGAAVGWELIKGGLVHIISKGGTP